MKNIASIISVSILISFSFLSCEEEEPEPIASFSASKSSAQINETISFTNTSKHASSYYWEFGDGSTSSNESPTHAYEEKGSFTVTLRAKGKGGENMASQTITISPPPPVAAFTMDKESAVVGEEISFYNTSENAESYFWDFGDGNTSSSENPVHAYATDGSFSISLTAKGGGGENTSTKNITVSNPAPLASFTMDKNTATVGEQITFTNESENADTYLWNFGDGNTSVEENPVHSYSEGGTFTVTLAASGKGGTHSTTQSIQITGPTYNIIPGERIGEFILGDDLETHLNKIDDDRESYSSWPTEDSTYLHMLQYLNTGIGFGIETDSTPLYYSDIPSIIFAFAPFEGSTKGGITFGSTRASVVEVFGEPDDIGDTGSYFYLNTQGITFSFDETGEIVNQMFISPPVLEKRAKSDLSKRLKQLLDNY